MAGGQQINSGQGNVAYDTGTVEQAVTGSAATGAQGSSARSSFHPLRSKKTGGGAASFLLSGSFTTAATGIPVKQVAALVSGSPTTFAAGSVSQSCAKALTGTQIAGATGIAGGGVPAWSVGAITLVEGQSGQASGQFNLVATGPSGYVAGGSYDVLSGSALPSGATLSAAGLIDVGTAVDASDATGVVFGYTEPNALPTLTLHNASVTGELPFMATAYPSESAVPAGFTIRSSTHANLRSSVLSTWPDGSAQVVVMAGTHTFATTNTTGTVSLQAGPQQGTALGVADIASKFTTGISVDFGGGVGTLTAAQMLTNYDRIWWQNSQVICARYRLAIPGKGVMEAVIDIHSFAGSRAFVEVVIENGEIDTAGTSTLPVSQSYTGATVSVNGVTIATVNSSRPWHVGQGTPTTQTTHEAFRAWYCSGWVGSDPAVTVTHDTAYLQAHPLFFEPTAASSYDFSTYVPAGSNFKSGTSLSAVPQTYGTDTYGPWAAGRHRYNGMGGTGDSVTIAYLPQWECSYIQTGSKYVANAVIQSGLGVLTFPIQYRDTGGAVPTMTQMGTKTLSNTSGIPYIGWPFANYDYYMWDYAHCPAVGLVAFLCRPSPCFIELAQKAAMFNSAAYSDRLFGYYYNTRGKAWCYRNLAFSVFLTPDAHPWKTSAKTTLAANTTFFLGWKQSAANKLDILWQYDLTDFRDEGDNPGFQASMWQHNFVAVVTHKAASAKLLTGTDQTNMVELADWACGQAIRFVTESTGTEWRYAGTYHGNIGTQGYTSGDLAPTMSQFNTWGQARAWNKSEAAPTGAGTWKVYFGEEPNVYSSLWTDVTGNNETGAEINYTSIFWSAFVAGVERGLTNSDAAWTTVNANVTNMSTFLGNGSKDCRFSHYPRNK
jgi:hypothetical protein